MCSGSLVHTVINLNDDAVAEKHGSRMTEADIETFKKAVKLIGESNEEPAAQKTHYDKFNRPQQRAIDGLVANRWLDLDGTALTIAPRARLELQEFLEQNGIARSQVIYH